MCQRRGQLRHNHRTAKEEKERLRIIEVGRMATERGCIGAGRMNCPVTAKKIKSGGERGDKPAGWAGDVVEGI